MLFSSNVSFADVETIDNIKVKSLISRGVPLIDIRSSIEWQETGVIEDSHLITFFNENGKVNLNKWMFTFNKVADTTKPFILICASGVRSKFASYILNNQFCSFIINPDCFKIFFDFLDFILIQFKKTFFR